MLAARSMGKPKIPVLSAGKAMEISFNSSARLRLLIVASFSFLSSPPSPHCGPTAWMTYFALRFPPPVTAASPTEQPPILLHSSWMLGQPFPLMAPATPVPITRSELAALTIASASLSAILPWISLISDRLTAIFTSVLFIFITFL